MSIEDAEVLTSMQVSHSSSAREAEVHVHHSTNRDEVSRHTEHVRTPHKNAAARTRTDSTGSCKDSAYKSLPHLLVHAPTVAFLGSLVEASSSGEFATNSFVRSLSVPGSEWLQDWSDPRPWPCWGVCAVRPSYSRGVK